MPQIRFTTRGIDAIKPPAQGQIDYRDTEARGLGLRVGRASKTWFVQYTALRDGVRRNARMSLGSYPAISLAEARRKTAEASVAVANGDDPARQKVQERQEAEERSANTFAFVAKSFMADHGSKLRTAAEYQRKLDVDILPEIGHLPAAEITRTAVRALVREKAQTSPTAANRVLALVSKIFNWAIDEELVEVSPALRIRKVPEETRERVLTDAELRAVWRGAEAVGHPYGALVRFLIVTGQRRGEVAGLTVGEIDGDTWRLPGERAKKGRGHAVPLSSLALDILDQCPRRTDTDLLFASTVSVGPIRGWSKFKVQLDKAIAADGSELGDWRLHDLRRSMATGLRSLGVSRLTVSKILNHQEGGVTQIYDRYAEDAERIHAMETWAAKLKEITAGKAVP